MKNSTIQWTDHTFNPWIGCTKVAPECKNCYAETLMDKRWGKVRWGKGQPRQRTSKANWKQPYIWNREAEASGVRKRVFCASLADVFDEEVEYGWRYDLWSMIQDTVWLDWQLLTKRPQNVAPMIAEIAVPICEDWDCEGMAPHNVWLGCSSGVDPLPLLNVPAVVHFLSCEPMLHSLDVNYPEPFQTVARFDWIIFGGESGKGARTLEVDWIRQGLAFCRANHVAAFVKQLGRNVVDRNDAGFDGDDGEWPMDTHTHDIDAGYQGAPVRVLLRDSHGGDMSEWPEELRVREFPSGYSVPSAQPAFTSVSFNPKTS